MGNGDKTRAQILKAFNDLMYEQGYNKTTIRQIAQRVGISSGNIYFYFRKKEEIMNALYMDQSAKLEIIFAELHLKDNSIITYMMQYYISFYLFEHIQPLKNATSEMLENSALLEYKAQTECKRFIKVLRKANIFKELNESILLLSLTSAYAAYFAACKLQKDQKVFYDVNELFNMYFKILFTLLDIEYEGYLAEANEKIKELDIEYIVKRVFELQDYDYEDETEN